MLWFHSLILALLLCLGLTFLFCSFLFPSLLLSIFLFRSPYTLPSHLVVEYIFPSTLHLLVRFPASSFLRFPFLCRLWPLLNAARHIVWFPSFTGSGRGAHVSDVICSLPQGRMPLSKLSNDRSQKNPTVNHSSHPLIIILTITPFWPRPFGLSNYVHVPFARCWLPLAYHCLAGLRESSYMYQAP
jgi:hypothetical protein